MPRICYPLLLSLLCCLLLLGCADEPTATPIPPTPVAPTIAPASPTSVPSAATPTSQSRGNFSRKDYEAALAKWNSAGIKSYQMTYSEVSLMSQNGYPWIVRVSGDEIEVLLAYFSDQSITPTPYAEHTADDYTPSVDLMFRRVAWALDAVDYANADGNQCPFRFTTRFNAQDGYPEIFDEGIVSEEAPTPWACASDSYLSFSVLDFQVLER